MARPQATTLAIDILMGPYGLHSPKSLWASTGRDSLNQVRSCHSPEWITNMISPGGGQSDIHFMLSTRTVRMIRTRKVPCKIHGRGSGWKARATN